MAIYALCLNCGNTDKFQGYQCRTEWGSERVEFNKEGNVEDYHGWNCKDSETTEEHIECCNYCQKEDNIMIFNESEERDYEKYIHTDEEGNIRLKPVKTTSIQDWRLLRKI